MDAGLYVGGARNPLAQFLRPHLENARTDTQAASDVRQVRSDLAAGRCAPDGMTRAAAVREEELAATGLVRTCCRDRGCRLVIQPAFERRLLHDLDIEGHQRVRGAAVFRTRPPEDAGPRGPQREIRHASGDHVHLAPQRRDPERVNDVVTVEPELHRLPDRQPDLVREHDLLAVGPEVAHAPPPLLPGDGNLQASFGGAGDRLGDHGQTVDQEGGQRDSGKHHAAAEDQPAIPARMPPTRGVARVIGRQTDDEDPYSGGAARHPPEEDGNPFGVAPGGGEGRLHARAAAGSQHRHHAGRESKRCHHRRGYFPGRPAEQATSTATEWYPMRTTVAPLEVRPNHCL